MDRQIVRDLIASPGPRALVTVADVRGSSPRHPGSAMVVGPAGQISGSVGGGRGEAMAIEAARAALGTGRSRFLEAEMLGSEAEGADMICGGINRMVVEVVTELAPYRAALALLEAGRRVLVLRRLAGPLDGNPLEVAVEVLDEAAVLALPEGGEEARKALSTGTARLVETQGRRDALLLDPGLPAERLLILGGGHVGQALAWASRGLGFDVTVVDDRPDFAAPGRFPPGVATQAASYEAAIDAFPFDDATYAVVVTRGHLFDLECSRGLLRRPFRYAGLIGSKRKVAMLRDQLRADGIPEDTLERLHSPVGFPIGSETPEEIAISIFAEIIAVRHNCL